MNEYRAQVAAAIDATSFPTHTSYTWLGHLRQVSELLSPAVARTALLASLQEDLYFNFYCLGYPARPQWGARAQAGASEPIVAVASAANAGTGFWEAGWTVVARSGTDVVLERDGLRISAPLDRCRSDSGAGVQPGDTVALRRSKELPAVSPGYYTAVSDIDITPTDRESVLRIYWSISPRGAASLMRTITTRLNRARLPFRLKVLNDSAAYARNDSAVLYIPRHDYEQVRLLLQREYTRLAPETRPTRPALTMELAPGVGLAEDPGGGESFGQNRCRLVAEGLIEAHEQGLHDDETRLGVIEQCFRRAGLSLDAPYLNPGSIDIYAPFSRPAPRRAAGHGQEKKASSTKLLAAAADIATNLSREAMWHDGCCSWIGVAPGGNGGRDYIALGPDLYLGTSGIAVFLAEVARLTGEPSFRDLAIGAISQALTCADLIPPGQRPGLYTGWMGLALSAVQTGEALDEGDLVGRGLKKAEESFESPANTRDFDLMGGLAGSILGLLGLRDTPALPSCLEHAIAQGDALLELSERTGDAIFWRAPDAPFQPPLTGLSHGNSGAALALAELFAASGEERFDEGARRAVAYETQWFSPENGNWPDFRDIAGPVERDTPRSFATAWCHGAPGIALSRMRAYELTGDEALQDDAKIALGTARQVARRWIQQPNLARSELGLCHGIAGIGDILLQGGRKLSDQECSELSARVAGALCDIDWGEVIRGGNPGLMVGAAGAGYFLIRQLDAEVPSLLLFGDSRQRVPKPDAPPHLQADGRSSRG